MSEWIKHDGKGMPVDGDTRVDVRWADGAVEEDEAAAFWSLGTSDWWASPHDPEDLITHYRIIDKEED